MVCNWTVLHEAARQPRIDRSIGDLYARFDGEVARHRPVCLASGRCCKFDSFGHRLYVTGLELARFLNRVPSYAGSNNGVTENGRVAVPQTARRELHLPLAPPEPETRDSGPDGACPYQVDNLCSVHPVRPLGCRVFFCQTGTEHWQHELYERYLCELKEQHERFLLPYVYVEWRAGLAEAAGALQ